MFFFRFKTSLQLLQLLSIILQLHPAFHISRGGEEMMTDFSILGERFL